MPIYMQSVNEKIQNTFKQANEYKKGLVNNIEFSPDLLNDGHNLVIEYIQNPDGTWTVETYWGGPNGNGGH